MPSVVDEAFDLPLAKRVKLTPSKNPSKQQSGSRIFSPFRTLGLVSPTTVPFTCVRLGKTTFQITTSVGHSLQTYDLRRGLNLIFLSRPQTPELITATYAWKELVFAAWGGLRPGSPVGVWVFKRGKKIAALETTSSLTGPILQILVFGSWIVGCCERNIQVWKSTSYEHYTTLNAANTSESSGAPVFTGRICNMPIYLNKIFVGRYDGNVDIWNLSTGKLLYSILPRSPNDGAVTALQPTPALSLLAIAYKSGALVIHNVDSDQPIISLKQSLSNASPITSITFRSDGLGAGDDGRKAGVMATATINSGDITIWDLNEGGKKAGVLRAAHEISDETSECGINRIEFLDGQPILISSGKDNALRSWIFDETPFSPIPRPLHSRSGHSAAVTALKFLPASSDGSESVGKWLLSASKDRSLWGFSLRKDGQNVELSQGSVRSKAKRLDAFSVADDKGRRSEDLKAPEITAIACSLNRDGGMGAMASQPIWANSRDFKADGNNANGWESIVTAHRGDKYARTWFWGKKRAGRWAFETGDGTEVKSVAISACGTFAVIGSAGGCIDMFNLQSGIHRQRFPGPLRSSKSKGTQMQTGAASSVHSYAPNGIQINTKEKHTKAVTGLAVDSLNRNLFWDFVSGRLVSELDWSPMTAITGLRYSNASELVAFSCDDHSIRVVDVETKKIVREFWGCRGQINDFTFSSDGRWVIAASMDSIIRVWDLPTGHLIDAFQVAATCTALAISGTGEFLVTAHADGAGINVWNNKTLFLNLPQKHIDENDITEAWSPTTSGELGSGIIEAAFEDGIEYSEQERSVTSVDQLHRDMMTLSVIPKSSWQTLLHLDMIRERNKPKEPPKAPEKAPFFLPSLIDKKGQQSTAVDVQNIDLHITSGSETTAAERSRIAKMQQSGKLSLHGSHISNLLKTGALCHNFTSFIDYFKSLSPAKVDLEIRSLDVRMRDGRCEIVDFVTALTERLRSKRDFELVNTWMAVFLRVHGDVIGRVWETTNGEDESLQMLQAALAAWKFEQQREAKRLSDLIGYCRGVVWFLRSAR
ncbi:WD repeat protein [Rasamsonia emersonii CBS 393.64]|uniref:WD repeat protein n=1 Tax=Rasamsonia emersonii (strain ATCC 16479 / CBS 393.64 / IMI 116815) TaxID=1408163 RepID=A0A0F4YTV8_RASE3|nr:WD repeat protein [Rasamsonia emersonii CBS 393.64]KKA21073.1 WD repeat protein [Rasamsonia emersonii CBS 393.64]